MRMRISYRCGFDLVTDTKWYCTDSHFSIQLLALKLFAQIQSNSELAKVCCDFFRFLFFQFCYQRNTFWLKNNISTRSRFLFGYVSTQKLFRQSLFLIFFLQSMPCSNKSSSEDEIANVNVLRRHRTRRGQSLRPLNWVPNFYCN